MNVWAISLLSGAICATAAQTQELRGPDLGVASNFGQGFLSGLMDQALDAGITDFRDAVYWDRVEQSDGSFAFTTPQTTYPDILGQAGASMSLTVNNGHPAYDEGQTPTSPAAVAGFGIHAAETVQRFPAIAAVEVGNEFNGPNFVSGPLKDTGIEARADAYAALLASVSTQVRAARPDVRIIGGGVHSIPTGYLQMLIDRGAAAHMDTLALHPYSTPVEHYAKQIAVLRQIPELAEIPIEITEFGTKDAALAPGTLIRSHCQYGLAGASRLAWYAVNERGDNYEPLIRKDGATTPTFEAFAFAQRELAGRGIKGVSPDPFTYACLYDDHKLVIWGMSRSVTIDAPGVMVFDAAGTALDGTTFTLSETEPLILIGTRPLTLGTDVQLGPQTIIADSYHGFTYPDGPDTQANGGFYRRASSQAGLTPFETMPGQSRSGRPWTPWLGIPENADVRLLPRTLLPGGSGDAATQIVHTFTADTDVTLAVTATFTPAERSADGIEVTVSLGTNPLWSGTGKGPHDINLQDVVMGAGDTLQFTVGPGDTPSGDVTTYRITLRDTGE